MPVAPRPPLMSALQGAHESASAMYKKTGEASDHVETMVGELGDLAKLGPSVTPDDVIDAAGRLAANSASSPHELAAALADMPEGGEALASWVQQHLQRYQQMAQQVAQAHAVIRHETAVSAMRRLAGALGQGQGQMPGSGPLTGSGTSSPGLAGMPPQGSA
jgi:hypothetical protein